MWPVRPADTAIMRILPPCRAAGPYSTRTPSRQGVLHSLAIVLVVLPFVPSARAFRGVSLLAARGLAPRGKGVCGRISMAGESKEWKAAQRVVQADGGNRANALRFWLESDYGVDLSAVTLKASPLEGLGVRAPPEGAPEPEPEPEPEATARGLAQ